MQKRRTHHFKVTLAVAFGLSSITLLLLGLFAEKLSAGAFGVVTDCIFVLLGLAAASFLAFSFFPYFRGDKRWFSISALLTVAFFIGTAILWQAPVAGALLA